MLQGGSGEGRSRVQVIRRKDGLEVLFVEGDRKWYRRRKGKREKKVLNILGKDIRNYFLYLPKIKYGTYICMHIHLYIYIIKYLNEIIQIGVIILPPRAMN